MLFLAGGAGNFVKMVHNGIEYGDMQLISEAYDVLKTVGGLTNEELVEAFNEWNAVRPASCLASPLSKCPMLCLFRLCLLAGLP
jgi:6-phosphogluconate dehydrogenase